MSFPRPKPMNDLDFVRQEMARRNVKSLDELKDYKVIFDSETGEPEGLAIDPLNSYLPYMSFGRRR